MATMEDVARLAGVSITTVSHVINGTRPASERTVRRVKEAIERTGYSQNTIARALARSRTQSLGLAVADLSNPALIDVIASAEEAARSAGYTLLLGDTGDDPGHELEIVRALVERRVDGLLLTPGPGAEDGALAYLARQRLPAVLLDRVVPAELDQVAGENLAPTAQLVTHLAEHGYRRIAMVHGTPGISTTTERIEGYRLGLRESGLEEDPALLVEGGSRSDGGRAAMERLLDTAEPPTAVVSGNNLMTIGILRAIAARGLRVPGDVALAGFDDFDWAELFHPRLTVIAQPTSRLGRRAVELLLSRLENPQLPPRTIRLEAAFRRRESCGCGPRVADAEPRRHRRDP
jgi:LacI family transcriptional regulator